MSSDATPSEIPNAAVPPTIEALRVEVHQLRSARDRLREQNAALVALSMAAVVEDGDPGATFAAVTEAAARMLQTERASVWLFDPERTAIRCVDLFEQATGAHVDGMVLTAVDHPRYFRALEEGRTLSASAARTDPRTSEFTEAYLVPFGIMSMLDAPIRGAGGQVLGVVCNEHVGSERTWSPEDEAFAGSVADLVSIALERLEREQAEATSRREQDVASKVIDSLPGVFYLFDENGRYLRWNKNLELVSGYTAEEMLERHPTDFVAPEHRAEIEARIAEVFESGRVLVETDLLSKDGRRTPYLFTGVRMEYDGRMCLAGSGIDLSERRQAEEALRESERRLRQVLDINPALIFAKDRAGRFTLVNQSLADVYGSTVDEIIGKTDADFDQNEEEVEFFRRIDLEVMNSQMEHRVAEEPVTDAAGTVHWFQTVKRPIVGDNGRADQVLGVATDITERKLAEEKQTLMMRELDHRVKNNLAAILSIADATATGAESLDGFIADFRGRIQAMAVAHEMLAHTSWTGAELGGLIERLVQPFDEPKRHRVQLDGPSLLLPVALAPTIAMVVHELATNAVKHGALSTPDGRIDVVWRVTAPESGKGLEFHWVESDGPAVAPPPRRGFGLDFIEQVVEYQLRGTVAIGFHREGLRCDVCLPLESAEREPLAPGT